jgi:hypothetical protein
LRSSCPIDLPKYYSESVQYRKKTRTETGDHMEISKTGNLGNSRDGIKTVSSCSTLKYASRTLMIA